MTEFKNAIKDVFKFFVDAGAALYDIMGPCEMFLFVGGMAWIHFDCVKRMVEKRGVSSEKEKAEFKSISEGLC